MQAKKNGGSDQRGQEPLVEALSEREIEILRLIADNLTKREIAEQLSLAYSTVKWYSQQTYEKLAVHSRRQAVLRARELGLLKPARAQETANGRETTVWAANPYKGLLAFQEADADDFFGREALTRRLVARLGEDGETARFLAVVGPSGSGKSSLVKAGLIPSLRHGALPGSDRWFILEMVPGNHPFEALAASLMRSALDPSIDLMEQLCQDEHGIQQAARMALPSDQSQLLLVIDQFEEIFTLVEDKTEASDFMESLVVAVNDSQSQVQVVITLRADFFDRLLLDPGLSRLVQDRTEVVIPLAVDEVERAIRAPAAQAGVAMDSGLVAAIVADMVEQPGALPLLQYALTEIFEQRAGNQLTLDNYRAVGGVRRVLERRAEETFAGLSRAGKIAARQVFLRLVTLGEGVSAEGLPVPDARRRVLRSELEAIALDSLPLSSDPASPEIRTSAALSEVLDAFGKARLLFFDRDALARSPTVEIAHEALLNEWGRLREWLEEGRQDVRMQRALGRAASEWAGAGGDSSFLLRGTRLSLFENWALETDLALTGNEKSFLEASLDERRAQQIVEATRKERAATLERRVRTFLRSLVIVLLLAALGSSALAWTARREAGQATSRELAVLAINNLDIDPERSILLSLQSLRTADTREAVDALHRAVQSSRIRMTLTGYGAGANSVEFSPDGRTLATASFAGEVTVWDTESWQKLFSLPGIIVRYSPDGKRLVTGSQDGLITIWDFATQVKLLTMKDHNKIDEIRFSPDGRLLVTTSDDFIFVVWDTETGQELFSSTAAYYPSFSPDGRLLITADETESGSVLNLWGVDRNWALLSQLPGYSIPVFSPDGRWLVARAGSLPTGIALWDLASVNLESVDVSTVKPLLVSAAHNVNILYLAFSPDGSMLVSTSVDGSVKVWRPSDQGAEPLMSLSGHSEYVFDASFSPDSARLATAGQDGTVRIWDITPAGASEWFASAGHSDNIYRLSLTQDGRYLATASPDGTAKVWDLNSGKELPAIAGHGRPLFGVSLSPDGNLLATAGYDNVARIWKLNLTEGAVAPEPLLNLTGHAAGPRVGDVFPGLTAVEFSPDSTRLATGGADGMARIWDVKTGQELISVQAHPDHRGVTSLAFSPDGRLLATTSDGPEPLAKIWDASNGAEISTFSGQSQTARIWGLAFSPDGERVATGAYGGILKIWDVKTGQELLNLVGHTSTVFGLAFSPDGKRLASASPSGDAMVWNASSGEEIQRFTSPTGALFDITFTPDGKHLITTGTGYIYGYILDKGELIQLAESRLTRGFTADECRQFLHQEECPEP